MDSVGDSVDAQIWHASRLRQDLEELKSLSKWSIAGAVDQFDQLP
jgi:hypothetical protein